MDLARLEGCRHSMERTVDRTVTADAVGSGGVQVLATPSMILFCEQAARDAVQHGLPEGFTTVGTRVNIEHTAAAPPGEKVTVQATVVKVTGRRILFDVVAVGRNGTIGMGTHERFVVNLAKFM